MRNLYRVALLGLMTLVFVCVAAGGCSKKSDGVPTGADAPQKAGAPSAPAPAGK